MTQIEVIICVSLVTLLFIYFLRKSLNLPPGPWGIPILGYIPFLIQQPHLSITKLGEKYGSVMSFYMGNVLVIILGDHSAIKEAFVKKGNLFSGKPYSNVFKSAQPVGGLTVSEGEVAQQHRKFILSTLKDFGMGKNSLEPHIMEEIHYLLDDIRERSSSEPVEMTEMLGMSVANIVSILEFGKRFQYSDTDFQILNSCASKMLKHIGAFPFGSFLPWANYFSFMENYTGRKAMKALTEQMSEILIRRIKEDEEVHVEGSKTHYIDGYLSQRDLLLQQTGQEGFFNKDMLLGNLLNLFRAGVETVTATLCWTLLYLIKYPEVLKKIQKEIDEIVGKERDPTMSDKVNMPFTDATILEISRLCSLVPFSLSHSNLEDTTLKGFHIPKRSYILANLWAVHHDKNLWYEPEKFQPERFLNDKGKVVKRDYLIPFSLGKRNCIGESLANMEVFLYLTTFLQQFDIRLPKYIELCFDCEFGITLCPKSCKIIVTPRIN